MPPLFPLGMWRISYRYLQRHLLQSVMMILGVALGVAVAVSIDVANQSAAVSFTLSTEALAGKATHQIIGGPQGLDENIYTDFKAAGISRTAAPLISNYVTSPQLGEKTFQLLGLDPFADAPFRNYIAWNQSVNFEQLITFLSKPGAVYISLDLARQMDLQPGSSITIEADGLTRQAFVAGLLDSPDDITRRQLNGVIIADIATAQEITGRSGWIDSIDLILPENDPETAAKITNWLPEGTRLIEASARQGAIREMTEAFKLNLTALSMLALLVGLFLIYNTMTFAVVQRRSLYGTMRSLGITRREVFTLVLGEAFLVGLIGSTLGIGLGLVLSQETVKLVSQTIEDLFFTTTVQSVTVPAASLVRGAALGIIATMLAAVFPAVEASTTPPYLAMQRSGLETKADKNIRLAAAGGVLLFLAGLLLFSIHRDNILMGFGGTFAIVMAIALMAGLAMALMLKGFAPLLSIPFGLLGKMAPRNLGKTISRTSVAVTALMIALAVSIGVGVMIESFRYTVQVWLSESLQGDIYISAPSFSATSATSIIDPGILNQLEELPGVKRVDILRSTTLESSLGAVDIDSTTNSDIGFERLFLQKSVDRGQIWEEMEKGGILVSEPLARRLDLLSPGSSLRLLTNNGWQDFEVLGVFFDYSSTTGTVLMANDVYQNLWQDPSVTAIGIRLEDGVDSDLIASDLEQSLITDQSLLVRPNKELRAEVMKIFDRTFAITSALRILATVVAFIGILNTLLLLQLEKQREMGILRALGLTGRQMWGLVMLETGIMGFIAGVLAAPTGYILAYILVYIINRRSFGWTLQLSSQPEVYIQALLVAVGGSLASWYLPCLPAGKNAHSGGHPL